VGNFNRRRELIRVHRSFAVLAVLGCFAMAAFASPALGATKPPSTKPPSKTTANVSCKKVATKTIRCTMTLKGGAGISGKVTMRITRGKVLVAVGHGRLKNGKATLTMTVLRPMTKGRYTVSMVITDATIKAKKVLNLG
jgi:hypothetical protein